MYFPIFRKLSNNKSFYRISSETDFEELQVVGSKVLCSEYKATKYPELIRLKEMIACNKPFEEYDALDYKSLKAKL
ncbi:hypothetical protein N9E11_02910 [Crocinitomicaceae bacterium]|nr:hypothetical protein [Crocinitomicaceae bacterium]